MNEHFWCRDFYFSETSQKEMSYSLTVLDSLTAC